VFWFEQLALLYFVTLVIVAQVSAAGMAAALVLLASLTLPTAERLWLGHAYLVLGYWLPALASASPAGDWFESWLVRTETPWGGRIRVSPWLAHLGELAYLMCYPFVPAAFVTVWWLGTTADVDRFWLAVLGAGFVCYITVAWLPARPPRLLPGAPAPAGALAHLNRSLLGRVSHNRTTFPSGHVAVAVAGALTVFPVSPVAGAIFAMFAIAIAVGAVTGRYHYMVDALAGLVVGIAVSVMVSLL
jgi:membrane-associated phospholipid phosphatase